MRFLARKELAGTSDPRASYADDGPDLTCVAASSTWRERHLATFQNPRSPKLIGAVRQVVSWPTPTRTTTAVPPGNVTRPGLNVRSLRTACVRLPSGVDHARPSSGHASDNRLSCVTAGGRGGASSA